MEKYIHTHKEEMEDQLSLGHFYAVVAEKHEASYGEYGASNIFHNVSDIYRHIQYQLRTSENRNVLLVGKVQSGKTSNLELLTAIAFDNGYNLLIIYGGYDNSLLKQTTDRFVTTFNAAGQGYSSDAPLIRHTGDPASISSIDNGIMEALIAKKQPLIIVSMKRPKAMQNVNGMLRRLDKSKLKAFIIDDEGDQASLNTAKDKIKDASATYKQIIEMKRLLDDPLYLSVTATPHANIFLDEWSALRPYDVRLIRPGKGYDGAMVYHLGESDIVELIADDGGDISQMPESLKTAIHYYIVASAIKRKRANDMKDCFSDMIIHSCREVARHNSIYTVVYSYIKAMHDSFDLNDADKGAYLQELRENYKHHVADTVKAGCAFDEIEGHVEEVVRLIKVILKNGVGGSTQGNEELRQHKIYIGGDLLQRGLTFPNLITTYFTRWANSGGNMDTNLQRARWFGYREKYIDLCKLFMTSTIAQEFTALAEVEEDLWSQFEDIENGVLKIDDILIKSDNTRQNPTSKQRVDYSRITFKNRWIKQKYLLADEEKIAANSMFLQDLFNEAEWKETTAGSRMGATTAIYSFFTANALRRLIERIYDVFDYDPFQRKALVDLLAEDNVPVIRMGEGKAARYRSVYPGSFRIKALQQGADSIYPDKITYDGDASVVVDKDKINIQVYKITPGWSKDCPMEEKTQYMFAIFMPKEKTYFIKGR